MKKIKLMLAGLMALFMSLTSVHVVSAATTYTLNVTGTTSGHTYEAYQIFSNDLDGSTLSNIKWGSGVDAAAAQANLGNARAKAEELNGKAEDAAEAKAFAQAISNYLASTPTKTVQSVEGTTTFFATVWGQGNTTAERTGHASANFIQWVQKIVAQDAN